VSEALGAGLVIGAALAASTSILALAVRAIGRAEARWERRERDRMLARHYGRDELP
jgi:hypothetical protein